MKSRAAALAFASGEPRNHVEVDLEGPKAGEVLIEVKPQESATQMHYSE